jgi:nicotinate phosphoribosyltransferase
MTRPATDRRCSPLLTDIYELTMLQSYLEHGMEETAVFEFFVRRLPHRRNFLVAAGLEQVLDFLETLEFSPRELQWLSQRFPSAVISYLERLRFSGDVDAMPEGTLFFADEPILRIAAPMPVAQLVESRVMNLLHFETLIASKAARHVLAAPERSLVDFGMRRAHGAEAGLLAARASYLAGFSGTATALAAMLYDIPVFGTMAHSFVQAHEDEATAFEHFARSHPGNVVLLIDTYDTEAGAAKVATLARKLREEHIPIRAVRIDSGDLAEHARRVRRILDEGGAPDVTIFASGGLDEDRLRAIVSSGAPIDAFGVGTALDTSSDAPALDCAYKLQEYAGRARRKRSEGKATWPGRKQVYRAYDSRGRMARDVLALLQDDPQAGEPLLRPTMRGGRRLEGAPLLSAVRSRTLAEYAQLPDGLRDLEATVPYPVQVSDALQGLAREVDRASR